MSYKTNQDFWNCFDWEKLQSYNQRNTGAMIAFCGTPVYHMVLIFSDQGEESSSMGVDTVEGNMFLTTDWNSKMIG